MRRLTLVVALAVSGCTPAPEPPGPPVALGGVVVSGEMMRDGAKIFAMRCATCHGPLGDGEGPTGRAQNPKPRDFRLGYIKYAAVRSGELATDGDYARTISSGLKGTNMLALPLAPNEVEAVTQYVKSLSLLWKAEGAHAGTPITRAPDPWIDSAKAVARGRLVVNTGGGCIACHASSLSPDDIAAAWRDNQDLVLRTPELEALAEREALSEGVASDSKFGWLKAPKLEGARLKAGSSPDDVYRTVAAGIGGTGMSAKKDVLSESDLWAVVHYVRSVIAHD